MGAWEKVLRQGLTTAQGSNAEIPVLMALGFVIDLEPGPMRLYSFWAVLAVWVVIKYLTRGHEAVLGRVDPEPLPEDEDTDDDRPLPEVLTEGRRPFMSLLSAPAGPEVAAERDYSTKAGTIRAICAECDRLGLDQAAQKAYVLATVDHETNGTFKPVREAYWLKNREAYLKARHPEYYPHYGRGYVQLTWERNYRMYGKRLGIDLVNDPDKALDPPVACFILVDGFKNGAFTGKRLETYVNAQRRDFVGARRCINGTDKAQKIARQAEEYLLMLRGHER